MPYPNEHAARQNDPKKHVRFRRKNNAFGAGIHAIYGVTKSGKTEVQSIRFDKAKFTVAQAKAWLKKHGYKTTVEPASGKTAEASALAAKPFMAAYRNVPEAALHLSAGPDSLECAAVEPQDGGERARTFSMTPAYSGKPFKHFWWGNFAADLTGMRTRRKIGITWAHDTDKRLGVIDTKKHLSVDPAAGLVVRNAPTLDNEDTRRVLADADQGFPFEASIRARPTDIEYVPDGSFVEVNGYRLTGPGHVFRKWQLEHIAVCVHGADPQTQSVAAADSAAGLDISANVNLEKEEDTEMADETELSIDELREKHPEIVEQIKAEAAEAAKAELSQAAKAEIAELVAMGVDEQTAKLAVIDGKPRAQVVAEFVARLRADHEAALAAKDAELAELKHGLPAAPPLKPADAQPSPEELAGEPEDWDEAKKRARAELGDKASIEDVARLACKKWPKLYEAGS